MPFCKNTPIRQHHNLFIIKISEKYFEYCFVISKIMINNRNKEQYNY